MSTSRLRLWPAYLIVGLLTAALVLIWLVTEMSVGRQYQMLSTIALGLLAGISLLIWFLFFSRLPGRVRLGGLATVMLLVGTARILVEVRGVTGDWVPVLAFRWAPEPTLASVPVGPRMAQAIPEPGGTPGAIPGATAANATSTATSSTATSLAASPPPSASRATSVTPVRAAGEFPQFQGPARDATIRNVRLFRDWSARPPRRLWRQPVGEGWSGFAVSGDLAITQEQRGDEERVVAYELLTGRPRWSHADKARYQTFIAGVGPRATPTIADGRVFAMGATGILNALDLATGRLLWTRKAVAENGGESPDWGNACSPLVLGRRVIVSVGGTNGRSLVAYDAVSGDALWHGGRDRVSYSSPRLVQLAGRSQIVMLNEHSFAGHDPETGALLWEHPWPPGSPNVTMPMALPGDRLLVSTGYGIGSKLFHVGAGADGALQARMEWESVRLKSKFGNLVVYDGWVYGLDDGVLTCLDPATGERKWKGGRYGHGQLLLVGNVLFVQTEDGEIVLLEPSPEGQRELTRFTVLDGRTWNPPALAGTLLVVRSDREAAVYELPVH